jgi:hypothetical protein
LRKALRLKEDPEIRKRLLTANRFWIVRAVAGSRLFGSSPADANHA